MVCVIQAAKLSMLIVSTAFTDRTSRSQLLSISSADSGSSPGKPTSMDAHPSPGTRLFGPSLPSFNPPIESTALFGYPATFLLPLSATSSPTKEGLEQAQSPASPCPPRRNLTAASAPAPLNKDRVPSSVSPEALNFPQLRPEDLDPRKMKGLAGNFGAPLLGSKRRAEDDGSEGDTLAGIASVSGGGSRKRPCRPISSAKVCVLNFRRCGSCAQLYQTVSDATSTPSRMPPQVFSASTGEGDTEDSQPPPLDDTTTGGVSCGVHYDGPTSRAEKGRLMSLLNGEDASQVASEAVVARPVARSASTSVKKAAASKKTTAGRKKRRTSEF
jgi:hypothetical protein